MKLKLRGHHLLCLQGFQGYGYDEDFVENMCEINRLRKLEDTSIKVVNSPDDICKACPNLVDNKCIDDKNNDKIIAMDNVVLSKIDSDKTYNSIDLFNEISQIFNTLESMEESCLNCSWWEQCLFVKKLENNR